MTPFRDMTDEQWQCVARLLPELQPRTELRGRPLANTRAVLNGVLWVMGSGATWSAMPPRYPSYQTCHRRFKAWYESGALKAVLARLYGKVGDEMHSMMEVRMRTHARRAAAPAHLPSAPVHLPSASAHLPAARERAVSLEQAA